MKNILLLAAWLVASTAHAQWGTAQWVWDSPQGNKAQQTNDPRYLRLAFDLDALPTKAELRIAADNAYVAWINGVKVGAGSEWQAPGVHDVLKQLVVGKNVLAIEARNQGGVAGVIARLAIGGKKPIDVITSNANRITQNAPADWNKLAFDDAAWAKASELGLGGATAPWGGKGAASTGGKTESVPDFTFAVADPKIKDRQTPEEQQKNFIVPEGFEVELVVADPLLINPVAITTDDKGRLYVSESHTYRFGPKGSPIKPFTNPIVRLDRGADGKFTRTLIAEGFDDPAMGLAIKGDKIWVSSCQFLYTYDLNEKGPATNKKTIVTDKNKAWNPFGLFVTEWGPDGQLYLSVGNHQIDLRGPEDVKMSGRGGSGIIVRMNPDGSKMERLVHGLRVPYSFEYDPFGQLWVLSNGEGNPNRFVRVIDGVDYHCYSRTQDAAWLNGKNPLAPPCFELHRGADTQLMRYYGAAYPKAYEGSLLVCNWGGHGFPGLNRGIFRFVPDDRNNIVKKEPFVLCKDPYFRPSHIALDQDGNLLIADWYGRDDESDMTGRIWRVKYTGKDRLPEFTPKRGIITIRQADPITSARVLWGMLPTGENALESIAAGAEHSDWRVRRLAMNLMRRYKIDGMKEVAAKLAKDADPAVRVEAGIALASADVLFDALVNGAAADAHLRYEAAWHLAKHGGPDHFSKALASEDANMRLAGLIAIDVACFEGFDSKKTALASLAQVLETPGSIDLDLALQVAQMNGDASLGAALLKLTLRPETSPAHTAKAILVMKSKVGGVTGDIAKLGKKFIESVEMGAVTLSKTEDQVVFLEFLESDGPTAFALKHLGQSIRSGQPQVRAAGLNVARKFGTKAASLADDLWPLVFANNLKNDDRGDVLAVIANIETKPAAEQWKKLLVGEDSFLLTEGLRWWRRFKGNPEMHSFLAEKVAFLNGNHPDLDDDLSKVLIDLQAKSGPMPLALDKETLAKSTLADFVKLKPEDRALRALHGKQVFDRSACVKCHTAVTQNTPLAPSLKGIAAQKTDYLVESILYPSKIIKTGFETEVVVSKSGKTYAGLVKDEGTHLRVLNLDKDEKIAKADVDERSVQKLSIMPEGQELLLSRRELVDLVAYLATLK